MSTEETDCSESKGTALSGYSKPDTVWFRKTHFVIAFCFTALPVYSTQLTLAWCLFFLCLTATFSFSFCLLWSRGWDRGAVSYLVLLDIGCFSGSCSSSELASVGFFVSDIQGLSTMCRHFPVCVHFLVHKECIEQWTVHNSATLFLWFNSFL